MTLVVALSTFLLLLRSPLAAAHSVHRNAFMRKSDAVNEKLLEALNEADTTADWRYSLPAARLDRLHASTMYGRGDVYEFGVYEGGSMKTLRDIFPHDHLWGFDSFVGLPETSGDVQQQGFAKGQFGKHASSFSIQGLSESLGRTGKVDFIQGFYNVSLTPSLREAKQMRPAQYIDIDCDLYVSSAQALDWIFSNGIAVPGTLIGYDDWWVNPCSKGGEQLQPLETGEGKAHAEIAHKYGVRFRCVMGPCMWHEVVAPGDWGPIFIVEDVGVASSDNGFNMTEKQINAWRDAHPNCLRIRRSKEHAVHTKAEQLTSSNRAVPLASIYRCC